MKAVTKEEFISKAKRYRTFMREATSLFVYMQEIATV